MEDRKRWRSIRTCVGFKGRRWVVTREWVRDAIDEGEENENEAGREEVRSRRSHAWRVMFGSKMGREEREEREVHAWSGEEEEDEGDGLGERRLKAKFLRPRSMLRILALRGMGW